MEKTYKITSTAIIHELLDDEVIIANLDTGIYYSLRGSAIPVWQLLLLNYPLSTISELFVEKYSVSVAELTSTFDNFTAQLLNEGLLVAIENNALTDAVDLSHLLWPTVFATPLLEKYEEMKNLLMLDPIHEVDEQGWPNRSA